MFYGPMADSSNPQVSWAMRRFLVLCMKHYKDNEQVMIHTMTMFSDSADTVYYLVRKGDLISREY